MSKKLTHERHIEDLQDADAFRHSMIDRADSYKGSAPLWLGWAIVSAYLAGLDQARSDTVDLLKSILNSDMAMREEDEGRKSKLLKAVRAAIAKSETSKP